MKYQELIDKYSNPNYPSRGSLNVPQLSSPSSKYDTPSRSQYSSELSQLERSNHLRNRQRDSKDYDAAENRSFDNRHHSPLPSDDKRIGQMKDSIFKSYRYENGATAPSPRKNLGYEDLRKTTGTDFSIRQHLTKSQHNSLLLPHTEEYGLNRDKRSTSKRTADYLNKTEASRSSYQNHTAKENSPPLKTEESYLTHSSHSKKTSSVLNHSSSTYDVFKTDSSWSACNSPDLRPTVSEFKRLDSPRASPRLDSSATKLDISDLCKSSHKQGPSSKFSLDKSMKLQPLQLKKEDFQIGKCKGDGKFGKVFPCRHIKTGTLYALKEIPKKLIQQNMMEDQLIREIKLQSYFNHSNLVKLYEFFSDETNIYLLMEYMEEGTLYTLLKKNKKFPEQYVSDRIREICTALHYLHDMDVVHRDIKLENVVLSNGVAKLCDFGWAAVINGRRTTYCGTFDYAPPEIIEGKDYNQNVDLWSLGVMTFEMLTGQLPFYNISRSQTIKNILNVDNKKINFPSQMSAKAQDFIERLLRKNPTERIRIDTLLKHPFLAQNPNSKSYV